MDYSMTDSQKRTSRRLSTFFVSWSDTLSFTSDVHWRSCPSNRPMLYFVFEFIVSSAIFLQTTKAWAFVPFSFAKYCWEHTLQKAMPASNSSWGNSSSSSSYRHKCRTSAVFDIALWGNRSTQQMSLTRGSPTDSLTYFNTTHYYNTFLMPASLTSKKASVFNLAIWGGPFADCAARVDACERQAFRLYVYLQSFLLLQLHSL